jgi:iron complex outermembrane recepter protein
VAGALAALGAGFLQAQATGTIAGRVLAQAGGSLPRAQVAIVGTNQAAYADDAGRYVFSNVRPGTYTLQARYLGYAAAEAEVTVQPGAAVTQNIRLSPVAIALEAVVVTVGSRAQHTAADELAVPVDVFSRTELQATAQTEMAVVLQELAPSVNFPRPQISDITSGVRPFQIRGLSPDHSLVLVNGQRRHSTAVVHVFGAANMNSGSSGVDMNAIPSAAIGAMEILRDGAAAQYGSDAIAGVVSLQLRDDVHDPEITASWGLYAPRDFDRDGPRLDLAGNWGISLFGKGTLNFTAGYSHRNRTHRAGPDPRDQLVPGDRDSVVVDSANGLTKIVEKRNPVPQPNHLIGDGLASSGVFFWNGSYPLGLAQMHRLYAFGGYSLREDIHSGYYRRGLDSRNWPQIHPLGFLPKFRSDTRDVMAVAGLDGRLGAWSYDVSGSWGQNRVDTDIFDSHNASLGPCLDVPCAPGRDGVLGTADDPGIPNKTDMYAGSLELNQLVASVDFTRPVVIGTRAPLNVALGLALRADNYQVIAGEPASYINGFHRDRDGVNVAQGGAQVFTGYTPDQQADAWRNNVGVYGDLETAVTDWLLLAGAARFERYSDFGETLTGKLAARVQPAQQLILRAAASTGFRAPALSQNYYAHVSTGPIPRATRSPTRWGNSQSTRRRRARSAPSR